MTEPKFIDANGVRFAYLEEGRGPLCLLLHGFPDTAHSWDAVRPALAQAGFRAVSPFTRGYAPTAIPADGKYDSETLGRDVLALISALGEERAVVVGHDWGAGAAYVAAALAPEKLRLLVTVAIPHQGAIKPSLRVLWGARHFLLFRSRRAEEWTAKNDFAHIDELVQRWSPGWKVPPGETKAVKDSFRKPGCLTAALNYYRQVKFPPSPLLRQKIAVPTVTFAADDDGILKPADYDAARRFFTSSYEVVHMPAGHFLHREHPQRFNDELLRVLTKARASW